MKYIKMFGTERSGLGFLAELLRLNARDITIVTDGLGLRYKPPLALGGMKQFLRDNKFHIVKDTARIVRLLENKKDDLIPIVVIKNPYTWYKSISRFRPGHSVNLDKEFQIYNELYKSCINKLHDNKLSGYGLPIFIKYETLLDNSNLMDILKLISQLYDVKFKEDIEIPIEIEPTYPFTEFKRTFYLSGGPYKLDTGTMNRITLAVDWETIHSFFSYSPIDPRALYHLSRIDKKELTAYMEESGILKILKKYAPKS
jgi:hypothetical protein